MKTDLCEKRQMGGIESMIKCVEPTKKRDFFNTMLLNRFEAKGGKDLLGPAAARPIIKVPFRQQLVSRHHCRQSRRRVTVGQIFTTICGSIWGTFLAWNMGKALPSITQSSRVKRGEGQQWKMDFFGKLVRIDLIVSTFFKRFENINIQSSLSPLPRMTLGLKFRISVS